MTETAWISLAVAVIGGTIPLITTFIQLKRDGKTIDAISLNTAKIEPTVMDIKEDTTKTKNVVVDELKPVLNEIGKRNEKIDFLATELAYQNRLKNSFTENVTSRDVMLAGITAVYEENARLSEQHRNDQEKIISLTVERNNLKRKLQKAENELRQYQNDRSRDDYEWEM